MVGQKIRQAWKQLAGRHPQRVFRVFPSAGSRRNPDFQVERKPNQGKRYTGIDRRKALIRACIDETQKEPDGDALVHVYERNLNETEDFSHATRTDNAENYFNVQK